MITEKAFELKKKILEIEAKNDLMKHEYHIKELEMQTKLEFQKFDYARQLQRLKAAGIKRTLELKELKEGGGHYG